MLHLRRFLTLVFILLLLAACRSKNEEAVDISSGGIAPGGGSQQLLVLPDDGVGPVLDLIENAEDSIRFKIYLLTYRDVRGALIRAANRGVDVRVIIEREPVGGGESNQESFEQLREGGVSVRWAPADLYRLTHEKSLVIDDKRALFGTFNYTVSSFNNNREYGILTVDPAIVSEVAAVFDADWEGQEIDVRPGSPLVLSPTNSRSLILDMIDGARETLWLEQATLLDDEIADHLVDAVGHGVEVRFMGPLRQGEDDFAEPNYERLRQAGAQVARLAVPLIHAKVILADGERAMVSSVNLTYSSMDLNRELGIVTEEEAVVGRLQKTMAGDWDLATKTLQAPEGVIPWEQAEDYVGAEVTVAGEIIRSHDTGKVTFLNFSDNYRDTLTIVIFASAYDRYPALPAEYFLNKRVQVSGLVKMYEGAPEIIVESPKQIEIIAGAEGRAGPEPTVEREAGPVVIPDIVAWEDAEQYMGEEITVEGTVVRTYDTGNVTFLNFDENWQDTLSLVIFAADYGKFPAPPEDLFLDQLVQVTGKVKEYKGTAEIVIEGPEQIEIIGGNVENVDEGVDEEKLTPLPANSIIPWQQAGDYLGQRITVAGRIVRANDAGSITFLNFSEEQGEFVAVVFADDYGLFPQPPADLYDGKQVWITGEIAQYKGVPQIIVNHPDQVEVFD